MPTLSQLRPLLTAAGAVLAAADASGCADDLTVTSRAACSELQSELRKLLYPATNLPPFLALQPMLAATTPDWCVAEPDHPENHGGTHLEIIDGYGRTATVYGEALDPEAIANAHFIALAHRHMHDLLEVVQALHTLREAYLNEDPKILDLLQGILAGDVMTEALEHLGVGLPVPNTSALGAAT